MASSIITKSDVWSGQTPILWHMEFRHVTSGGAPLILEWSDEYITDPSTYAGGPKEGRVTNFGQLMRKLSDRFGRLETASLSITLRDDDHLIRAWFADPAQRNVLNVECSVWVRRGPDRANAITPAPVWHGLIKSYQAVAGRLFRFDAWDPLSSITQQNFPWPIVSRFYPSADPTNEGARMLPRWYGLVSDEGIAGQTSVDYLIVGGGGGGGSPSDFTGSGGGGGGQVFTGTDVMLPGGTYAIVVGAGGADAGSAAPGGDGGYSSFNSHVALGGKGGPGVTGVGGASASGKAGGTPADAHDGGGGGGDSAAGGNSSPGVGGAGGAGTSSPLSGSATVYGSGGGGSADIGGTPGAGGPTGDGLGGVWSNPGPPGAAATPGAANTGDGGGGAENQANSGAGGSGIVVLRYLTAAATSTGGTTTTSGAYTIVTFTSSGTFTLTVLGPGGSTKGVVPGIYVGGPWTDATARSWSGALLFAGHACAASTTMTLYSRTSAGVVTALASLDDTQVSAPGRTGFTTRWGATPYRTINGWRMTQVYVDGALAAAIVAKTVTVWANFGGVETVGDSTGTLLTSPVDFMAHLLDNDITPLALGLPAYSGGNWASSVPTWGDGRSTRNTASFTNVKNALAILVPGDTCAFGITDTNAVCTDIIAGLARDGDFAYGPDINGGIFLTMEQPDPTIGSTPDLLLTDISEIKANGLQWVDQTSVDYSYNQLQYQFGQTFDASGSQTYPNALTLNNGPAQLAQRGRILQASETQIFLSRRDSASAAIMANRVLRRGWPAPRDATVPTGIFAATGTDLGGLEAVTDGDGPGGSGFLSELMIARAITVSPTTGEVQLDVRDIPQDLTPMIGDYFFFGGSNVAAISNAAYPTGATGDKLHQGTGVMHIDAAQIPAGTYVLELEALVDGGNTLTVGLFNLTDAPNTAMVTVSVTGTVAARYQSATITFAAAGAVKDYGIKVQITAPSGFAYLIKIKKVA